MTNKSLSHRFKNEVSVWDRLFKLIVLLGVPLAGWVYFSQHSEKSMGHTEIIVPFRVEKAPPLEGLTIKEGTPPKAWKDSNITVVNFWASWCQPCVEEMPAMAELASRLAPLGVKFNFVSVDDNWEKVQKFLQDNIIDLPANSLYWDPNKEVAFRWKSEKFPETYVVNPQGWMIEKIVGFQDWTRPSVISYFKDLAKDNKRSASPTVWLPSKMGSDVAVNTNNILTKLAFLIMPMAHADDKSTAPLIHEDDKKNLAKLQQNVETANRNLSKLEAAKKEEDRSYREIKIKIEREEKDRAEVNDQLLKVKDSLKEVDRVRQKNDDSLASEKLEKDRVQKESETLQAKQKDLEKELNKTRDEIILSNQKISTRLQNIESFEKALASSKDELKSLKDREKKLDLNVKKEDDVISEMQHDASKRDSKVKSFESDLTKWNETLNKEKQKLAEFEKLLK